jgi:hypothetical protein
VEVVENGGFKMGEVMDSKMARVWGIRCKYLHRHPGGKFGEWWEVADLPRLVQWVRATFDMGVSG